MDLFGNPMDVTSYERREVSGFAQFRECLNGRF
jgi:hypothetical protein